MSANGTLRLDEVRPAVAAALAPQTDADPPVFVDYPDSVDVPALVVIWDDPWLTPTTMCLYNAQIAVLAVAGRVDAGPGVDALEQLAAYTVGRMRADGHGWAQNASQAPRNVEFGGVVYLGARVGYRVPVTIT